MCIPASTPRPSASPDPKQQAAWACHQQCHPPCCHGKVKTAWQRKHPGSFSLKPHAANCVLLVRRGQNWAQGSILLPIRCRHLALRQHPSTCAVLPNTVSDPIPAAHSSPPVSTALSWFQRRSSQGRAERPRSASARARTLLLLTSAAQVELLPPPRVISRRGEHDIINDIID